MRSKWLIEKGRSGKNHDQITRTHSLKKRYQNFQVRFLKPLPENQFLAQVGGSSLYSFVFRLHRRVMDTLSPLLKHIFVPTAIL
jgi:hypothetical protein